MLHLDMLWLASLAEDTSWATTLMMIAIKQTAEETPTSVVSVVDITATTSCGGTIRRS